MKKMSKKKKQNKNIIRIRIIAIAVLSVTIFLFFFEIKIIPRWHAKPAEIVITAPTGTNLNADWGSLGSQMVESGVIDEEKLTSAYLARGGFPDEFNELITSQNYGRLKITQENSGYLLNLFWALGLSNETPILSDGMMQEYSEGNVGGYASTGGWSLAVGDPMDHYSMHQFIKLTDEQTELVKAVTANIFRPCCNNPTLFPDCNHGMAMLGFLELLASQGASENEMYQQALVLNTYWFPDTYLNIAKYLDIQGGSWDNTDPKEILGPNYSSASGYRNILSQIQPVKSGGGGGCSV